MNWNDPNEIRTVSDGDLLNWWLSTHHDPWFQAVPSDEEWLDQRDETYPGTWTVIDAENMGVVRNLTELEARAWEERLNRATGKPKKIEP